MKRLLPLAVTLALGATVMSAGTAHANDKTVQLKASSGAVHAVLSWDDSVDTLCLTLKSRAAGASASADMQLVDGSHARGLDVSASKRKACTGNLSIPEDRRAQMRVQGGTNTWWDASGWVQFYT